MMNSRNINRSDETKRAKRSNDIKKRDTYCTYTTMLWTLMLGMVQKALRDTQQKV